MWNHQLLEEPRSLQRRFQRVPRSPPNTRAKAPPHPRASDAAKPWCPFLDGGCCLMLIEKCSCMQYCKTARFRNDFVLVILKTKRLNLCLLACLRLYCCSSVVAISRHSWVCQRQGSFPWTLALYLTFRAFARISLQFCSVLKKFTHGFARDKDPPHPWMLGLYRTLKSLLQNLVALCCGKISQEIHAWVCHRPSMHPWIITNP